QRRRAPWQSRRWRRPDWTATPSTTKTWKRRSSEAGDGGRRRAIGSAAGREGLVVVLLRSVARARLASQVIRRLRRAGVTDARYDATAFSVRFTSDGDDVPTVLPLDGLLAPSRQGRRSRLDGFVAGLLRTRGLPVDFAEARPLL